MKVLYQTGGCVKPKYISQEKTWDGSIEMWHCMTIEFANLFPEKVIAIWKIKYKKY